MVKNLPANAGDIGSIPGLGGSPGGGNNHPLQYSHSSIPTPVFPLQYLAWEIPCTEEPGGLQSMGLQKSWIGLSNKTFKSYTVPIYPSVSYNSCKGSIIFRHIEYIYRS